MKKLLTFLLMLCITTSAFAKAKIATDKEENGFRTISCKMEGVAFAFPKMALTYVGNEDNLNSYYLNVRVETMDMPICIEKGYKILIKTMDDQIIELTADETQKDEIGELNLATTPAIKEYSVIQIYKFSESEFDKLRMGVKKVRIQCNPELRDKDFGKDKLGKMLIGQYELIQEKLNEKAPSIYDGF